ncbi:hypothetical protein CL689_01425 [Candidatus Saccharibacteria bacterium]|nr:hypothetical protein [Candidatus Saccharibacteria bacterium]MBJ58399.1 hypothetical protein [Candidatus Saccharibacteria bacterium]MBQ68711.1 hypothetical protein [Candidatus Saccharibacteria bacterium]|tara:strand:+ start:162 stop:1076 length:915 start_codon:yes stop_codon:yes gene_type:complete
MKRVAQSRLGFTIVELLIVIVVIAILAAITIVAYNGIQQSARLATVQSDLTNNAKLLETVKTSSASEQYPANQAAANLRPSQGTTLVYTAYTTSAGAQKGYCLQATQGQVTYFTTAQGATYEGSCTTVTNIVLNPNIEQGTSGINLGVNSASCTRQAAAAEFGSFGLRCTTSSTSDSGAQFSASTSVTAGTNYTASFTLRNQSSASYAFSLSVQNTGGTSGRDTQTLAPGESRRFRLSWTPGTSGPVAFYALRQGGQSGAATFDVDGVMLVESSTATFADGSSPNWRWNGTADNSSSTGPVLGP